MKRYYIRFNMKMARYRKVNLLQFLSIRLDSEDGSLESINPRILRSPIRNIGLESVRERLSSLAILINKTRRQR